LPYRITAPGHYCLASNLSTSANPAFTSAITIDADSVVLDLNQFTLDGSAAGTGSPPGCGLRRPLFYARAVRVAPLFTFPSHRSAVIADDRNNQS